MFVHPDPAPEHVVEAWAAAVDDAGLEIDAVALIWRPGRPRPTGQQGASWRPGSLIDPEFDDDQEFIELAAWANRDPIRALRRVMVWVDRSPEGLDGLLRHELEHTSQIAYNVELDALHGRATEELTARGATNRSYNEIPMEVDANRAAARFLRRRHGADRLRQLVGASDLDAAWFRPTANPEPLDTLADRMRAFIGKVMRDESFVSRLEATPSAE